MSLEKIEISDEISRLRMIADACQRHGEADGENAARSQIRALEKEVRSQARR